MHLQGTYSSSIDELAELRSGLKLGDVVSVQGRLASRHEVRASAISVLRAWRESHPHQTFQPQASPLRGRAAQQQQQQQTEVHPAILAAVAQAGRPPAAGPAGSAAAAAEGAADAAAGAALAACKYFVNTGRCSKGDACRFAHLHTGALRQRWLGDM